MNFYSEQNFVKQNFMFALCEKWILKLLMKVEVTKSNHKSKKHLVFLKKWKLTMKLAYFLNSKDLWNAVTNTCLLVKLLEIQPDRVSCKSYGIASLKSCSQSAKLKKKFLVQSHLLFWQK